VTLIESLSYKPVELAFGTSGLRGLVTDMTDLECYINAAGFLRFLEQVDGVPKTTPIYLAGDLRDSTPRITQVMLQAIADAGYSAIYCGKIPTPAVAFYALTNDAPCIMVTGSHIPADRNGIKFYKAAGEVLKADESAMQGFVAQVRAEVYNQTVEQANFSQNGQLKSLPEMPIVDPGAEVTYKSRYTDIFSPDVLAGKEIVLYQHSAVGRDIIGQVLESLGATVIPVGRSDVFIPIDTENVREPEKQLFKQFVTDNPNAFAVVSTDGDSDRPFVIDETGEFHRGDVLGCVTTGFLGGKFAAVPISSNDAVDAFCEQKGIEIAHTKIGSPYVIVAMQQASVSPTVGWEVNGGFLTGGDITLEDKVLKALPTRDALLPILCALLSAVRDNKKVSEVFAALPARYTGGGLIDVTDEQIVHVRELGSDIAHAQQVADSAYAGSSFGNATLDTTDGLRMVFENGEVMHLRASGNAPQVRVYTNAATQERADTLADEALARDGYITKLMGILN
jgi:phosphomannomutase